MPLFCGFYAPRAKGLVITSAVSGAGLFENREILARLIEHVQNLRLPKGSTVSLCIALGSNRQSLSDDAKCVTTILNHMRRVKTNSVRWRQALIGLFPKDQLVLKELLDQAALFPWGFVPSELEATKVETDEMEDPSGTVPQVRDAALSRPSSISSRDDVLEECEDLLRSFGGLTSHQRGAKGAIRWGQVPKGICLVVALAGIDKAELDRVRRGPFPRMSDFSHILCQPSVSEVLRRPSRRFHLGCFRARTAIRA